MDLLGWVPIRWLVVAHVASAIAFLATHGPAMYATFALRRETDAARVGALLDLSRSASVHGMYALALLSISGAWLATVEHAWRMPWVWGSIVVLVAVSALMPWLGARAFNHARHAAGVPWFDGKRTQPGTAPDAAALRDALGLVRRRVPWVAGVGFAGAALLVWLMTYQPG